MKKITSQTLNVFFDKGLKENQETLVDKREFTERFGMVDLLLNECLNPSKDEVIHQVCSDASPEDQLDEEADHFIEKLFSDSMDSKTSSSQSLASKIKRSKQKISSGTLIADRYEVKEYLGEGSFGEVYRGYHNLLKIEIAIKALKKRAAFKPQVVKRFIREAQIMANINHPNVIRIYDVGDFNGQIYLIMKYIDGMDLERYVDEKINQPLSGSTELMIQISEALSIIHNQGVIHRDIKPANIMIDNEGNAILMDFGIAKAGETGDIDHRNLTVEGNILGTPSYMAPEQFKTPDKTIKATDVYALGVTFYHMVTGKLPFSGNSFLEVYENHKTIHPPPTHTLSKDVDPRISKIISKMLEKDPSRRYPDGAAVAEALRKVTTNRFRGIAKIAAIVALLALIIFSMVRTKMTAKDERGKAQLQTANSLIAEGNGLALIQDWNRAKSKFNEAFKLYKELKAPTIIAELGLWEVHRNSPPILNSCIGHATPPLCMAISPTGRLGLSGSSDGEIIVWDLLTGEALRRLANAKDSVPKTSVTFSSDSSLALASNFNGKITLWDVKTGKQVRSFNDHGGWVHKVIFSPDDTMALSGDDNGSVVLWNISTGEKMNTLRTHKGSTRSIAFSKDGKMILSGSSDKTVALWDVGKKEPAQLFTGHKDEVTAVSFSEDSRSFLSSSNDGTIKVWDIDSGKATNTYNGSESAVLAAMFLAEGASVLAGQYDSTVIQWDLNFERPINVLSGDADAVTNLTFSSNGKILLGATEENQLTILSTTVQREVLTFLGHKSSVRSVDLTKDGRMAVSGGWDGTIIVWDAATGYPLCTLTGHKKAVTGVKFTPDGTKVVSASLDGTAKLWSLHSAKTIRSFASSKDPIAAIDISPNGKIILTGYRNGDVVLWDLKSEVQLKTLNTFNSSVRTVAFSRDEKFALAGSSQGELTVWDMSSFDALQEFDIEEINSATFTPDGQGILCGYTKGMHQLYDIKTGRELQTFGIQSEEINAIECTPDGLYGISGSQESPITVWELENGRELFRLRGHREDVMCLSYSQADRKLISGSKDKTVKLWDFSRLLQYSQFKASLPKARELLKTQPQDPNSLNILGEWYFFRGMWDWANELLIQAKDQGFSVSPLTLARCYWQLGNLNLAYQEFHNALGTGEAPDSYLQLCMTAIEEKKMRQSGPR